MARELGNYRLISKLGEGGMAEVWLGEHKSNLRKAAIKILKLGSVSNEDYEKLFLREARVLADLDHPNIVRIYDNDRTGDEAYLVMELLPGGTLQDRMRRGPISVGGAIALIVQLANALQAAHARQLIHRDLKPANVMFRANDVPVLTDFGAVRVLGQSTIFGRDGGVIGTPGHMSPEQIFGQPLTGRSDLYLLGVLFYELLVGTAPYPGRTSSELASQHLYAPIPQLPVELAALQPILARLMAKDANDRFGTADELVEKLRSVFLSCETLRQQIGYAGSEAAWSSQLRALGFLLGPEAKTDVRIAQGQFLAGRASELAVTEPMSPVTKPMASKATAAPGSSNKPSGVSPSPDEPAKVRIARKRERQTQLALDRFQRAPTTSALREVVAAVERLGRRPVEVDALVEWLHGQLDRLLDSGKWESHREWSEASAGLVTPTELKQLSVKRDAEQSRQANELAAKEAQNAASDGKPAKARNARLDAQSTNVAAEQSRPEAADRSAREIVEKRAREDSEIAPAATTRKAVHDAAPKTGARVAEKTTRPMTRTRAVTTPVKSVPSQKKEMIVHPQFDNSSLESALRIAILAFETNPSITSLRRVSKAATAYGRKIPELQSVTDWLHRHYEDCLRAQDLTAYQDWSEAAKGLINPKELLKRDTTKADTRQLPTMEIEIRSGARLVEVLPRLVELSPEDAFQDQRSDFYGAFQSLITTLILGSSAVDLKCILVTSALASEGKTTTALILAKHLAQSGRRTLLIDAHLRNPTLHKILGTENSLGLSTLLSGGIKPAAAIVPTKTLRLTLMPSGPMPPNPVGLLADPRMNSLLTLASEKFDCVIIDSPPLLNHPDSVILSQLASSTLLITEAASYRDASVQLAVDKLAFSRAKLLGLVLTKFSSTTDAWLLESKSKDRRSGETLCTALEIEKHLGIAALANIPRLVGVSPEGPHADENLEFSVAHFSLISELNARSTESDSCSIFITSSIAGEGKSTTALTLARNYAKRGSRVLLIDANLRNPSLHLMLGNDNSIGLSNYLAGATKKAGDILEPTQSLRLSFISSGPSPPNPVALLTGPKMSSLITRACERFDKVVIDGPAVLNSADSLILANMCSSTLIVIEAGNCRIASAESALRKLRAVHAQVVGAVLVKYSPNEGEWLTRRVLRPLSRIFKK